MPKIGFSDHFCDFWRPKIEKNDFWVPKTGGGSSMYDTTYRLPTASFGNDLPPTPKWYRIPFQISNFIHPPTLLVSDTISNFTFYTPHPPNLVRFEELFSKNCILFVKVVFFCEKWYNFHCKNDNFLVKNG